jgi:hypothetical protein
MSVCGQLGKLNLKIDWIILDHGQRLSPAINIAGVCTDNPMMWSKQF